MKKIPFLFIIVLINNRNNPELNDQLVNHEENNLEVRKQEITTKIQNLKTEILAAEETKNTQIATIKNDIETLEKELKTINLEIINTEIELLHLVFNKEQTAFQERNNSLEEEIKSLQKTQDAIATEIKSKQERLGQLHYKKTTLNESTC
jgi:hypothetical protein